MIKNEQEFYKTFDMQVQLSRRRLRRIDRSYYKTNAWNYDISDSMMYPHNAIMAAEEVECVDILMPKDRLGHLIAYVQETEARNVQHESDRQLMYRYEQDRVVRLNNPAVEKAYQKYVMLLELARK
jgi:hypothetical protein